MKSGPIAARSEVLSNFSGNIGDLEMITVTQISSLSVLAHIGAALCVPGSPLPPSTLRGVLSPLLQGDFTEISPAEAGLGVGIIPPQSSPQEIEYRVRHSSGFE